MANKKLKIPNTVSELLTKAVVAELLSVLSSRAKEVDDIIVIYRTHHGEVKSLTTFTNGLEALGALTVIQDGIVSSMKLEEE